MIYICVVVLSFRLILLDNLPVPDLTVFCTKENFQKSMFFSLAIIFLLNFFFLYYYTLSTKSMMSLGICFSIS